MEGTALSRVIPFANAGGPEVLEFIETQVPAPGPHEVRIKVKAIGINRDEVMWREGKFIKMASIKGYGSPVGRPPWNISPRSNRQFGKIVVTV